VNAVGLQFTFELFSGFSIRIQATF
jgi:hypothetical protein